MAVFLAFIIAAIIVIIIKSPIYFLYAFLSNGGTIIYLAIPLFSMFTLFLIFYYYK